MSYFRIKLLCFQAILNTDFVCLSKSQDLKFKKCTFSQQCSTFWSGSNIFPACFDLPWKHNIIYFLCFQELYEDALCDVTINFHSEVRFKGIVSDSNNIFFYESEDIDQKRLFPKLQLIPILLLPFTSYA